MEIQGKVIKEPENPNDPCTYTVQDNQKQYQVVSKGKQALKDYFFIQNGQEIHIQGKKIGKDKIQAEKSRIKINLLIENER